MRPARRMIAGGLSDPAQGGGEHVSERTLPEVRGDASASHRPEGSCVSERAQTTTQRWAESPPAVNPATLRTVVGSTGMPQTVLTPTVRDQIARLGSADIMVGIPSFKNAATIGYVVRAAQAGLVQYFPDLRPVVVNSDAGSPDGTGRVVVETEPPDYVEQILLTRPNHKLERVSLTYPEIDGVGGKGAALRTIFEIAAALEVQALVVVDSDLRSIVPEWIELLSGPILKGGYDFVAPLYARYKYDGTITNTVTYPLTRALYGHRIRQPIGGDFGVSGDLVRHYLSLDDWTDDISKFGIDIWMTTSALTGGFAVCQTRLGAKIHDPKDPGSDLGPMFRQVVGTILRLAVANADTWLSIRDSHAVPAYGFERIIDPPPLEVNTLRLLSEFHAGSLTLVDKWTEMLSKESLETVMDLAAEAGRLGDTARAKLGIGGDVSSTTASTLEMAEAVSEFHFPDDVWSRVIYDLVVTARNPTHPIETFVAALVPIYFGRVGSFVIENRHLTTEQAEERVERQAREFELLKPYLVQRWNAVGAAQTEIPA
jgi:glucosylglycerate synthase